MCAFMQAMGLVNDHIEACGARAITRRRRLVPPMKTALRGGLFHGEGTAQPWRLPGFFLLRAPPRLTRWPQPCVATGMPGMGVGRVCACGRLR